MNDTVAGATAGASAPPTDSARFRRCRLAERVRYDPALPVTVARMSRNNFGGMIHILDLIRFRPMPSGLLAADHPWVTGVDPRDGLPMWPRTSCSGRRARRSPEPGGAWSRRLTRSLPVGRAFMASLVGLGALAGGWDVAGVLTLQSGVPLAVTQATNVNACAGFGSITSAGDPRVLQLAARPTF
jgi:hypothetical protein